MNEALVERIKSTISARKIVLFMKGRKESPQCGFSGHVVSILTKKGVEFLDVDVLLDPQLREGLKAYGKWPTFPQLYVDGKLVGGADIVSSLDRSGELEQVLGLR